VKVPFNPTNEPDIFVPIAPTAHLNCCRNEDAGQ